MARTVDQIETIIDDAKAAEPLLANMNSASNTAIYKLFRFIAALAHYALEVIFDSHKTEVNEKAAAAKPLTLEWYRSKAFEFQYGDTLTLVNGVATYAVPDDNKKIVSHSAAEVSDGTIVVKARKAAGVLDVNEKAALEKYYEILEGAGDGVLISSLANDLLKLTGIIWFNPLVPLAIIQADLIAALEGYVTSINFNGRYKVKSAEDAIQEVSGIGEENEFSLQHFARADAGIYASVDTFYKSSSGFVVLDPDFKANITNYINFQPNV